MAKKLSSHATANKVARLGPIEKPFDREAARQAAAEVHQLTVDDASYLELTLRRRLPLATRDADLAAAAKAAGAIPLPTSWLRPALFRL